MTYTREQVARALGVPARRVEGWIARGILKPIHTRPGTGTPHRFRKPEIIIGAIVLHTQQSFGARFIRPGSIVNAIRTQFGRYWFNRRQLTIGEQPGVTLEINLDWICSHISLDSARAVVGDSDA